MELSLWGRSREHNHFDALDGFSKLLQLLFDVLVVGLHNPDLFGLAAVEPAGLHLGHVLRYVSQLLVLLGPADVEDVADAFA